MEADLSSARIFTEFSGLQKLKLAAKNSSPEALEEVANHFEAFFVKMMLSQMREASLADGIFDSDQMRFYQDMMDQQLALHLSDKRTFGIADSIIRQLSHTVPGKEGDVNSLKDNNRIESMRLKLSSDISFQDQDFENPGEYINKMRPYAEKAASELGIPANILLAQSALETGWGNKVIHHSDGKSSHNLFGIKADERWDGQYVKVGSLEYRNGTAIREYSDFRVYDSYQQSFNDYVDFIKTNDRYRIALDQKGDGAAYLKALQDAGYATDPQYANKIINIIRREAI